MNFFEHQDHARRKTGRLILLFVAAVIAIVVSVNVVVAAVIYFFGTYSDTRRLQTVAPTAVAEPNPLWNPAIFMYLTPATLLIIGAGSLYKTVSLSRGGHAVASLLGGRPLQPNSYDSKETVLHNVVEEMSIASGVPVPQVYVLDDEDGINAFAAGFNTEDAVIGVTRGCLQKLNRDELQGVIAHEFSHVFNGDMRLNLRLIGVLHGILVIALIGYWALRSLGRGSRVRTSRRGKGGGQAMLFILAIGIAMLVIGYVGVFFGRLIQAAVSRQREYLADASAVQFTRNPDGIAGALKKIGGAVYGSRVENHNSVEMAHLFFGSAFESWTNLLATHPPLPLRIRRIDPSWDGRFVEPEPAPDSGWRDAKAVPPAAIAGLVGGQAFASQSATSPPHRFAMMPETIVERVGRPTPQHVAHAHQLIEEIPGVLREAAHDPFSARAIVCALLLNRQSKVHGDQLSILRSADPALYETTLSYMARVERLGPNGRLPLLDLSVPALRRLSDNQAAAFRKVLRDLIQADRKVVLLEYVLFKIVEQHTRPAAGHRGAKYHALAPLTDEVAVLLSALARADRKNDMELAAAYTAGIRTLGIASAPEPKRELDFRQIESALDKLADASPGLKRRIVEACAHCVAADRMVQLEEAELLRAITTTLDCPLPPFLEAIEAPRAAVPVG